MKKIKGFHHITAIASNAQVNYDFYKKILGLRFVKKTVNFDDPESYHFYFGDKEGKPGSLLTFFIWPNAQKGRVGIGTVNSIAFRVKEESLGFWLHRLIDKGITHENIQTKFGQKYISFVDPDGLNLELIGYKSLTKNPDWFNKEISEENAIIDICGVNLIEESVESTQKLLEENLDYKFFKLEGNLHRFLNDESFIDLTYAKGFWEGVVGNGMVHHIAFDTPDQEMEEILREDLIKNSFMPTEQINRKYFYSVYFREPGGVLFEIATSKPGFTIDESIEELGMNLMLPSQYERFRSEIEKNLDELRY